MHLKLSKANRSCWCGSLDVLKRRETGEREREREMDSIDSWQICHHCYCCYQELARCRKIGSCLLAERASLAKLALLFAFVCTD